jgi:hypothetical protein
MVTLGMSPPRDIPSHSGEWHCSGGVQKSQPRLRWVRVPSPQVPSLRFPFYGISIVFCFSVSEQLFSTCVLPKSFPESEKEKCVHSAWFKLDKDGKNDSWETVGLYVCAVCCVCFCVCLCYVFVHVYVCVQKTFPIATPDDSYPAWAVHLGWFVSPVEFLAGDMIQFLVGAYFSCILT